MNPIERARLQTRLHPGETPREYRDRIGHVATDPRTWGPIDTNPDACAEGSFIAYACGCRVVGNGTLPYPYAILRCGEHEAAPALRGALAELLATMRTLRTTEWGEPLSRAVAAMEAAELALGACRRTGGT